MCLKNGYKIIIDGDLQSRDWVLLILTVDTPQAVSPANGASRSPLSGRGAVATTLQDIHGTSSTTATNLCVTHNEVLC